MFLSLFLNMVSKSVSPFTSASQLTYSKRRQQATRTTETNLWAKCAVVKLARSFPLTCYPGCGFIWGWFRRWLRSSSRWRRLSVWRTQLCLGEPLHHCAVLGVTVPAAALLLPAVLGHYKVIAAVVAEDATAKPKGWFMYQKNEWGVILLIKHILSLFFLFFLHLQCLLKANLQWCLRSHQVNWPWQPRQCVASLSTNHQRSSARSFCSNSRASDFCHKASLSLT